MKSEVKQPRGSLLPSFPSLFFFHSHSFALSLLSSSGGSPRPGDDEEFSPLNSTVCSFQQPTNSSQLSNRRTESAFFGSDPASSSPLPPSSFPPPWPPNPAKSLFVPSPRAARIQGWWVGVCWCCVGVCWCYVGMCWCCVVLCWCVGLFVPRWGHNKSLDLKNKLINRCFSPFRYKKKPSQSRPQVQFQTPFLLLVPHPSPSTPPPLENLVHLGPSPKKNNTDPTQGLVFDLLLRKKRKEKEKEKRKKRKKEKKKKREKGRNDKWHLFKFMYIFLDNETNNHIDQT